jgi:hypothetical protein
MARLEIGLEKTDDSFWNVYFGPVWLGRFHEGSVTSLTSSTVRPAVEAETTWRRRFAKHPQSPWQILVIDPHRRKTALRARRRVYLHDHC